MRTHIVPRSRLLDSLRASVEASTLTLLSAPIGYGKTNLLVSLPDQPVVWVSLDGEDNVPARFFVALLKALQKPGSGCEENTQSLFSTLDRPASEPRRIISELVNEVMEKLPEAVLIFDDHRRKETG